MKKLPHFPCSRPFALAIFTFAALLPTLQIFAENASSADPKLSRLFLTWQQDPTSTMTVQWLQTAPTLPLMEGQSDEMVSWQLPYLGEVDLQDIRPDWLDKATRVYFFPDVKESATPTFPDPAAPARDFFMGWNEDGLVLYVEVTDATPLEGPAETSLWGGDSIEIFVSEGPGSQQRYQYILAPGTDPNHPAPRAQPYDYRESKNADLALEYHFSATDEGYVAQVLLPWENLGISPDEGNPLGLQIYVNDRYEAEGNHIRRFGWQPDFDSSVNIHSVMPLVLSMKANRPVRTRILTDRVDSQNQLEVYGTADLVGETLTLRATDLEIARTKFVAHGPGAKATFALPTGPEEARWGALHVYRGEEPLGSLALNEKYRFAPLPKRFDNTELTYFEQGSDTLKQAPVDIEDLSYVWPGHHRFRVELTGLKPDTAYRFKASGFDGEFGFRTMPATLDRPLRLALGGDTRHQKKWLVRTNRVAMSHNPDFIVWGGDLAYANGNPEEVYRWEEWFDGNDESLIDDDGFITPIVLGIGNHEVAGGYYYHVANFQPTAADRARIAPFFYAFFAFPDQPGYDVLDFGDYLSIVMLDSDHSNPIEGKQTKWLSQVLAERDHFTHVLPIYHVPGYPSVRKYEGRSETAVREHWYPLFDAHNIRLAFEHNDHAYKRTPRIRGGKVDPDGTTYFGDGAWGVAPRTVHDPETTWYLDRAESVRHAIILTLDHSYRKVEVYDEHGNQIDSYEDDRE